MSIPNFNNSQKILVTGGAGYIGSHTSLELLKKNYKIVVIDNLSNSSVTSLLRVAELSNKTFSSCPSKEADIIFYEADIRNIKIIESIFKTHDITAVIHFAGLKSVAESVANPISYFNNNIAGSIALFNAMETAKVKNIVFSSSATVYGSPKTMPIDEYSSAGNTSNPYGRSKFIIEKMLEDLSKTDFKWKICILRYFNPVGAHSSGRIGEDPLGTPNNLMPFISQVAVGKIKKLKIFGNSYPTKDGTGVRDYIHVVDLAKGHISALNFIMLNAKDNFNIFNLGTGKGTSVLELCSEFEKASGKKIPYEFVPRREGDIAECWASVDLAESSLGWKAAFDTKKMCEDSWRWQYKNPNGYES